MLLDVTVARIVWQRELDIGALPHPCMWRMALSPNCPDVPNRAANLVPEAGRGAGDGEGGAASTLHPYRALNIRERAGCWRSVSQNCHP